MSTAATPLFIVLAVAAWACLVVAMYAAASSTEQNDVATCWRVLARSEGHDDSGCTSIRSTPDPTATIAKMADKICTVIAQRALYELYELSQSSKQQFTGSKEDSCD